MKTRRGRTVRERERERERDREERERERERERDGGLGVCVPKHKLDKQTGGKKHEKQRRNKRKR